MCEIAVYNLFNTGWKRGVVLFPSCMLERRRHNVGSAVDFVFLLFNPENIFFKQELYDKLYEAYDSLEYTEKIMLAQHLGFCPECFSTRYADKNDLDETGKPKEKPIKPLPYTDIATDHGFSDADTAKRVCVKAFSKIKHYLFS